MAIEIDLFDKDLSEVNALRLCNVGPLISNAANAQFLPRSTLTVTAAQSINVASYGQPKRIAYNIGEIAFAIDDDPAILEFVDPKYSWLGRAVRIFSGTYGVTLEELILRFVGSVSALRYEDNIARIAVSDRAIDFDIPLQRDLYLTGIPANVGNPKPLMFGAGVNIEPVLSDPATLIYDISLQPGGPWPGSSSVSEVRVGGVPWTETGGVPSGPQYLVGPSGQIQLGSSTAGGEVRVDVSISDDFLLEIERFVVQLGGSAADIDIPTMTALRDTGIGVFGHYSRAPINALDAFDDIFTGLGCWWGFTVYGLLTAGRIAPPSETVSLIIDRVNIISIALTELLPPVVTTYVAYNRNWQPSGQFFGAVSDEDQSRLRAANQFTTSAEFGVSKTDEPRALDSVTLLSTSLNITANINNATNMARAWSATRRIFAAEVRGIDQDALALYDTVAIDYRHIHGNYRVISIERSYGGGSCKLQLWG